MDGNLLALIAIAVLAVLVGLGAFRFWARRRLRETAADRRVTAVPEMLQEFGRSVIVGVDPAGAGALIEGMPKRKAKVLSPGVWGIDVFTKRDVVIELRPAPAGTEVLVTSLAERSGFPQGLPNWQSFASQLEQSATASGVQVQRGQHAFRYAPPPASSLDPGSWVVAD